MDDTTPTGPRLPTQQAIEIMNQNAAAVAARSRIGQQVVAQRRVGRDALRRDHQVRMPSAQSLESIPEIQEVPQDTAPPRQQIPDDLIRNLVNQFQGFGGTGGGGGGSVGGGGGGGSGGGGNTNTGANNNVGWSNPNGVQTFTGDPGATFIGQSAGTGYTWKNTGWRYPGSQPMGASLSSPNWKIQNGTWWQRVPLPGAQGNP